jgi:hypothetical protein
MPQCDFWCRKSKIGLQVSVKQVFGVVVMIKVKAVGHKHIDFDIVLSMFFLLLLEPIVGFKFDLVFVVDTHIQHNNLPAIYGAGQHCKVRLPVGYKGSFPDC